jgi:hypothetical protein
MDSFQAYGFNFRIWFELKNNHQFGQAEAYSCEEVAVEPRLIQSTLVSATSMMGLERQGWLEHMDVVVHSMEEEGGVNRDPATGQS